MKTQERINVIFKDPSLCECMAYREFNRTKGLSAFNWSEPVTNTRKLNQHATKTTFKDESYIIVSSCKNLINNNRMTCYTKNKEVIAVGTLF